MQVHPLLADFITRHRIEGARVNRLGWLSINLDRRLNVHILPGRFGQLVLEAQIGSLPEVGEAREAALEWILQLAGETVGEQAAALLLDRGGTRLLAQQRVAGTASPAQFDLAMEQFIHTVQCWRRWYRQG